MRSVKRDRDIQSSDPTTQGLVGAPESLLRVFRVDQSESKGWS